MSNVTEPFAPSRPGSTSGAVTFGRFFDIIGPQDRFCEGRWGDIYLLFGRMEPFNTGTAIFIAFFGFYGLFVPRRKPGALIQFLFALVLVNGITSAIVHGSGWYGFGQVDAISIVVMLMLGCSAIVDELAVENGYICPKACCGNQRFRLAFSTMGYLTLTLLALVAIGFNASDAVTLSNIFVGVTTGVTVILSIVIVFIVRSVKDQTIIEKERLPPIYKKTVTSLMVRTFVPMVLGLVCWAVDAFVCPFQFPYLHGFWHLLLGYAMLCLISFASYIRADNDGDNREPQIRWANIWCCGYYCCRKGNCCRTTNCCPWTDETEDESDLCECARVLALPSVDWVERNSMAVHVPLARSLENPEDKEMIKTAVAGYLNEDTQKLRAQYQPAQVVVSFADPVEAQGLKRVLCRPQAPTDGSVNSTAAATASASASSTATAITNEDVQARLFGLQAHLMNDRGISKFEPKEPSVDPVGLLEFYASSSSSISASESQPLLENRRPENVAAALPPARRRTTGSESTNTGSRVSTTTDEE